MYAAEVPLDRSKLMCHSFSANRFSWPSQERVKKRALNTKLISVSDVTFWCAANVDLRAQ